MMNITITKNYSELSVKAAELFYKKIKAKPSIHLGLATGKTPLGMYEILRKKMKTDGLPTDKLKVFNLDEYVGLSKNSSKSFYTYMKKQLYEPLGLKERQYYIPNGEAKDLEKECLRYEQMIDQFGIDLQLLGVGRNGHIGFNEPGTPFDSLTHVVKLKESTRKVNASFFGDESLVPTRAITMGIQSILKAKEIVVIASGEEKARALYEFVHGKMTEEWPITALKNHSNVTVICDQKSARFLKRKEGVSHD
ncbi:glucosamine-6-phosphate deaminase [Melghiribacillus thermohalophilus]|uniref:Glucosamine-6-phosphate deaminase n=2 Tax=Melghiribacillus thermohalophilus TaxID=1324956 RepID=A0A4R3MSV3_9BACI|nr:glucosamine-6-phosphate deaminase [Melghiribacillus thermohalophilus]